jgi:hypothetical protein
MPLALARHRLEVCGCHSKREGEQVKVCLIGDSELTDAVHRSTLDELTNWVQLADRRSCFSSPGV